MKDFLAGRNKLRALVAISTRVIGFFIKKINKKNYFKTR